MAREKIKCPGCDCKVSLSEVEKNDGACPECGQQLFGITSTLFDDRDEEEDDDEFGFDDEDMELEDEDELDDEDEFEDDDEDEMDDEDDEDDDV